MTAVVVVLAPLVALSVWEGLQSRQSAAAHWSVGLVVAATVVATVVLGRGRQPVRSGAWASGSLEVAVHWRRRPAYSAGLAVWVVLLLAVIGWDLNSFVHQAHDLPTLSYLVGRVTSRWWGRAAVAALWLAAGVGLAVGCLADRRRRPPS